LDIDYSDLKDRDDCITPTAPIGLLVDKDTEVETSSKYKYTCSCAIHHINPDDGCTKSISHLFLNIFLYFCMCYLNHQIIWARTMAVTMATYEVYTQFVNEAILS
jgi:hypothetical protein